jgi:hypothetical protein
MRIASAGVAVAKALGLGHVDIHSTHAGSTRFTGVCWSMNSLTITPHGSGFMFVTDFRQGKSRAQA